MRRDLELALIVLAAPITVPLWLWTTWSRQRALRAAVSRGTARCPRDGVVSTLGEYHCGQCGAVYLGSALLCLRCHHSPPGGYVVCPLCGLTIKALP
jgi:hypothetical protein